MCRNKNEREHRCSGKNAYGKKMQNLQAKKQYHTKKGNTKKVIEISDTMANMKAQKHELIADGGKLLPYTMELTPSAKRVMNQLRESGFKPYIVGGSVRDALMGAVSKDVDIEVYGATANEVIKSLRKIGNVDEVGKSFGVLKIAIGKEDFDISLPRRDSKVGDGHKGFEVEVAPDMSMKEATSRRDFTINALMYDDESGFIIDKHSGLEDLKAGYLRHVSEAFDEDPLRVLRGVQMASRFNMTMHPDTVAKAQTLKDEFKGIAVERVQVEFEKLYTKGKAPHKAIQLLQDTGWDKNFSGLQKTNLVSLKRDLKKTQGMIDNGEISKGNAQLILSSVMAKHMEDKDAKEFLRYTTIGDDMKNGAYNLSRLELPQKQGKAALRAWARDMPRKVSINDWSLSEEATGDKKKAQRIRQKATKLGILHSPEPDMVNGNDVMEIFDAKPGKWLKPALDATRHAQYSDDFRTKEDGIEWVKRNIIHN